VPLLREQSRLLAVGLLGLSVAAALGLVGPWLVAQAIDIDLAAGDRQGLIRRCAQYLAVLIGAGIATWLARVALEVAAQRALLRLKQALFDHLVQHDLQLHERTASGSLVGRLQGDIGALRVLLVEVVFALPADAVLVVGMLTVLLVTAPRVAWPVAGVVPIYAGLLWLFRTVAAPAFLTHRKATSRLTGVLAESVGVLGAMRALGRHLWLQERAAVSIGAAYDAEWWSRFQPTWFFNAALLVRSCGIVGVLAWGGLAVASGEATVGALVMALAYLRQLFSPLMRLSHQLSTLEQARAAARRLDALFDEERTLIDPVEPVAWPGLRDELRFEGVDFAYVEGTPVLQQVDLRFRAGSTIGLVGATGAGKSTVVDLLLRFRDPTSGRVTIDGTDLRDIALSQLRDRSGLVLQDVRLLPGTVLDNLGGDAASARRALDRLGLDLPLEQAVHEARLSRGERQLLTFARALVDDPELLVLDEATSAIDPATEARVQAALETLLEGRTAIVVAHRLDTVRRCDAIVVLHQGRVREVGTHDALLASGGLYADLVALQEVA
jgi:ATP-binding cassette subfamily B protein